MFIFRPIDYGIIYLFKLFGVYLNAFDNNRIVINSPTSKRSPRADLSETHSIYAYVATYLHSDKYNNDVKCSEAM